MLTRVQRHQQVPARVTEPAGAGGLAAHVSIVEHRELVGQQLGDSVDVTADVGDDPNPDLVGDVPHRVGMRPGAVALAGGLGGERRDGLGPAGDGQIVDARVVEDARPPRSA